LVGGVTVCKDGGKGSDRGAGEFIQWLTICDQEQSVRDDVAYSGASTGSKEKYYLLDSARFADSRHRQGFAHVVAIEYEKEGDVNRNMKADVELARECAWSGAEN
jgi:hypothetical protein